MRVVLNQSLQAVIGQQALIGIGDVLRTQIGKHGSRLRRGRLHARTARIRGQRHGAASLLSFRLRANLGDPICRALTIFRIRLLVTCYIAAGTQHAQIVIERGYLEIRHRDVRRCKRIGQLGLRNATAAAAARPRQNHEIGVERDNRFGIKRRKITDLLRIRRNVVIGESVVGRANQRTTCQLPHVCEAAHASNHAIMRRNRHFAAQIIGKGICALSGRRLRFARVRRNGIPLRRTPRQRERPYAHSQHARKYKGPFCSLIHCLLLLD